MRTRDDDPQQVLIVALAGVCFVAILLIAGFDRRFQWSRVPGAAVVIADLIIVASYGLFLIVLRENRTASRVIEVIPGQQVVASGPYAIVRHPMYTAVAVSWWAVVPALGLVPILVARIHREERMLITGLAGYAEYMRTTVYRLIPGLW
jgi:protein-S-isoprenylcysteine O-methyltransferase Ste14